MTVDHASTPRQTPPLSCHGSLAGLLRGPSAFSGALQERAARAKGRNVSYLRFPDRRGKDRWHRQNGRMRQSSLGSYLPFLDKQWASGCRNGAGLWRRLQARGFRGSQRVVGEWATRRRRAERASDQQLLKVPSARTIARLMTAARDHLSKADSITIAAIEAGVPMLVEARSLIDRFQSMIRKTVAPDLDPWIADASASLIAAFTRDKAAGRAAVTEPWSNGQTERQIPNSSWSSSRCTAEQSSTCCRQDSSVRHEPVNRHRDCVRATIAREFTRPTSERARCH